LLLKQRQQHQQLPHQQPALRQQHQQLQNLRQKNNRRLRVVNFEKPVMQNNKHGGFFAS
jgi:hypothetical protein